MLEIFEKFKTYFRKHKFEINGIVNIGKNSWPIYECKMCKKTLQLEGWQMESLPPDMARGCPGK